jgi:hypothetical protein
MQRIERVSQIDSILKLDLECVDNVKIHLVSTVITLSLWLLEVADFLPWKRNPFSSGSPSAQL